MKPEILITDELHPLLKNGLEQYGYTVDYRPNISAAEVLEIIERYTGLIINSKVYAGKELLAKAAKLKFVARAGSGLEVIDLEETEKRGVAVINSPEGNRNAVAEHALGMLLSIMNNLPRAYEQIKNNQWVREPNRGNELSGKTIGLLAYGNTAQTFAKLLSGFEVTVLAYDKYLNNFSSGFVKQSTLTEIFEQADVLSIHLPLTNETEWMVDYRFLSTFKKSVWLVNTSRGKVLKTTDLLRALHEGKVTAAALDVLENEKLASFSEAEKETFNALTADNRILLSPHIAGWTHESKQRIAEVLLQKILAI